MSSNVIDLFPYIRDYTTEEVDRKRFGSYRLIVLLLLWEKADENMDDWTYCNPIFMAYLRRRLEDYPRFQDVPREELGRVIQFPEKKKLLESPDGNENS